MSRSIWKGPFSSVKAFLLNKDKKNKNQNIWCRHSMILPQDIGKEYKIYNGKRWTLRKVVESMVGHKFGEFASTREKVTHKVNKKRQMSRKK